MKKLLFLLMPVFFSGQFATAQSALTFDATVPSYVEVGSAINVVLQGTNTITAEGWCYLTDNSGLHTITGNYLTGMQFLLRIDGGTAAFWVDNGSVFNVVNGGTTIPLNTWTHLAGVWDGSELRVYVDGVLDGTTTGVNGAFPSSSNSFRIGANQLSEGFTGNLDAVGIWATARTVPEINASIAGCLNGGE